MGVARFIPIIDVRDAFPTERTFSARKAELVCHEIDLALRHYGFFYIVGHGIEPELIAHLREASKTFFSLPQEMKDQISMEKAGLSWRGYFPVGGELTSGKPDNKEGLYFGVEHSSHHPLVLSKTPLHGCNQWPIQVPHLKVYVTRYISELAILATNLMEAIGIGLKLPAGYFLKRFTTDPTLLFRLFNYPGQPIDSSQDSWGVGEHTDMGFLTVLYQEKAGLQVKLPDQTWIEAPPIENSFVINIGDMLELWTGGIYVATPHRVRNEQSSDRLSIPFFFDPNWHSTLEKIPPELLPVHKKTDYQKSQRWDGLQLDALEGKMTYGEFVWKKVAKVFPNLATSK